MKQRTARSRDANGRFATEVEIDLEALRGDYEGVELSLAEVAIKHSISASTLHRMVVKYGWTPRAPHRIDPDDLVMRMFAALDAQMQDLETMNSNMGVSHTTMLNRLVTTLDKLIEIKDAEARKRRTPKQKSKEITDLRAKIADRIAELNEP